MRHLIYTLLALTILLGGTSLSAQSRSGFSLGAAMIGGQSAYAGLSTTQRIVPSLSYEMGNLKIGLPDGVNYTFLDRGALALSAGLTPNLRPFDEAKSSALSGMERSFSVDATLGASFTVARGSTLRLKYGSEITNENGGQVATLSFSQFIPIAGQPVILSAGAKWQDAKRSKYVYGVYAEEVTSTRAAYDPGATVVPYVSVNTFFDLTDRVNAFVNVSATFLPDSVTDSPIVSEKTTLTAILGLAYRF